jgi:hypothetical protein
MDTATQAPATDDQELAKVLESMNASANTTAASTTAAAVEEDTKLAEEVAEKTADELNFEETPVVAAPSLPDPLAVTPAAPVDAPIIAPLSTDDTPIVDSVAADPELDSIKKDALSELRPLVDKLDLPADEKFDTLLLIIRSTDDKSLVSAAHEAAKAIEDEKKRAEALLDVIKEIDFFSNPQK